MTSCRLTIYPWTLFALVLFSCHKKDVVGPQGPTGPQGPAGTGSVSKGDIQGKVVLYDTLGNPLSDNSGATVLLENTSPAISALSAVDGSFTIPGVHTGYYNISVQKQGYGTMRYLNFANAGFPTASQTGILQLAQQMPSPQYDIKSLKADSGACCGGYYLNFTAILASPQKLHSPVIVLLYFNDSTGVSASRNRWTYWANFYQQDDTTLLFGPFDYGVANASAQLYKADSLYISAAIINPLHLYYKDENGNQVYPGAGKMSAEVIVNNVLHKY